MYPYPKHPGSDDNWAIQNYKDVLLPGGSRTPISYGGGAIPEGFVLDNFNPISGIVLRNDWVDAGGERVISGSSEHMDWVNNGVRPSEHNARMAALRAAGGFTGVSQAPAPTQQQLAAWAALRGAAMGGNAGYNGLTGIAALDELARLGAPQTNLSAAALGSLYQPVGTDTTEAERLRKAAMQAL